MDEDYYESDSGNTAVQNYDRTAIPDPSQPSGYRNDVAPQLNAYQAWNPQAPQLNIPTGEVDWDYVNRAVSAHRQSEALQRNRRAAQAKSDQEAVRFAGQRKFQELVDGGATPQEALRLAGNQIFFQDPEAQVAAMFRLNDQINKPEIREAGGVVWERNKEGKWDAMTPLKQPNSKPSRADMIEESVAKSDYNSALRSFEASKKLRIEDKKGKKEPDHSAVADAARRLRLSEQHLKGLVPQEIPISQTDEKELTKEIALEFLKQSKGDRAIARKLAKEAGYKF